MTKPGNPSPMTDAAHLMRREATPGDLTLEESSRLLAFVRGLAADWARDGSKGDNPGVAKAAFDLLEEFAVAHGAPPPPKRYVVALGYPQFVIWCQDQGISPMDRKRAIYVNDWRAVAGIAGPKRGGDCELVILRGAGHNPKFAEILKAARDAGF